MNREKIRENAMEYSKTESAKQAAARYQEKHKEEIKEKRKTNYICECGFELSVAGKYKHQKTLHHRIYLLNK